MFEDFQLSALGTIVRRNFKLYNRHWSYLWSCCHSWSLFPIVCCHFRTENNCSEKSVFWTKDARMCRFLLAHNFQRSPGPRPGPGRWEIICPDPFIFELGERSGVTLSWKQQIQQHQQTWAKHRNCYQYSWFPGIVWGIIYSFWLIIYRGF